MDFMNELAKMKKIVDRLSSLLQSLWYLDYFMFFMVIFAIIATALILYLIYKNRCLEKHLLSISNQLSKITSNEPVIEKTKERVVPEKKKEVVEEKTKKPAILKCPQCEKLSLINNFCGLCGYDGEKEKRREKHRKLYE